MVVIDTSVAYKWFNKDEELFEEATKLLIQHINQDQPIIVPELLFLELANAWSTKTKLTIEQIKQNFVDLEKANLQVEVLSFDFLYRAMLLARTYQVSVYDAIYAVLAKEKKCDLITADNKFAAVLDLPFIKTL